jgi:hypothetical protein
VKKAKLENDSNEEQLSNQSLGTLKMIIEC